MGRTYRLSTLTNVDVVVPLPDYENVQPWLLGTWTIGTALDLSIQAWHRSRRSP